LRKQFPATSATLTITITIRQEYFIMRNQFPTQQVVQAGSYLLQTHQIAKEQTKAEASINSGLGMLVSGCKRFSRNQPLF
jgi:hypothetical protein